MAKRGNKTAKAGNGANLGFEEKLWQAADKLRGNMDAADYKHVVLGLIFLKYISDAFQERYEELKAEAHADPEDRWRDACHREGEPDAEGRAAEGLRPRVARQASIGRADRPRGHSILSDQFLAEVKELPHKNLAFEVLKKLLSDEIKTRTRKNLVQSRRFSEMLENTIRKYQNRSIETAQVIQELIELAKDMREAHGRGERLGFTEEELAFYDALEVNDSAVKVLGDETLKAIARELVDIVRRNVSIDWTVKESVRAKLRTMVKRILRKHGYPPDKQESATQTVLKQAELLCGEWVA